MRLLLSEFRGLGWDRGGVDDRVLLTNIAIAGLAATTHHEKLTTRLAQDVMAIRKIEHEGTHFRQSLACPYNVYAATALRYCIASLRRSLRLTALAGGFSEGPVAIPLFPLGLRSDLGRGKHALLECLREIDAIYETWMALDGLGLHAWLDAFGSKATPRIKGLLELFSATPYADSDCSAVNPLSARALLEGAAQIAEIFWVEHRIGGRREVALLLERELLNGHDVYGATLRLVVKATGMQVVPAALLTSLMIHLALTVKRSSGWPLAIDQKDALLDVVPGLRFADLLAHVVEGKIPVHSRELESATGYLQFVAAASAMCPWLAEQEALRMCTEHIRHMPTLSGLASYSDTKYHVALESLQIRAADRGFVFALPWLSDSVRIRADSRIDPLRVWFADGTVTGPAGTTIDTLQEFWDIACYSWYERILESGGLFTPRPLAFDGFVCCRRQGDCESLRRGDAECAWVQLFEECIGVPPSCFIEH